MGEIIKKFYKNKYNINIVMCCASCRHHMVKGEDNVRMCKKYHMANESDYLCTSGWEMDPSLDNAGKGGGKVKRGEYLRYVLNKGILNAEEWEKEHGSKYLSKR